MLYYLIKRILLIPITLVCVLTLIFFILRVMPGDPVAAYLGEVGSAAAIADMKAKFGLDKPLWTQYFDTISRVIRGDFGRSFRTGIPVIQEILMVLPNTISLAVASFILSNIIGIVLAVISSLKVNRTPDYIVSIISLLGVSVPVFWSGFVLQIVFSYYLGWFPVASVTAGSGLFDQLKALFLPSLCVSFLCSAYVTRVARCAMIEVLGLDFIRTVKAKGAKESMVVFKHVLKNAMIPLITVGGLNMGILFGGTVLTETVFARMGVGKLLVDAVLAHDYPLIEGIAIFLAIIMIITNLIVDILYSYFDPRVKYR